MLEQALSPKSGAAGATLVLDQGGCLIAPTQSLYKRRHRAKQVPTAPDRFAIVGLHDRDILRLWKFGSGATSPRVYVGAVPRKEAAYLWCDLDAGGALRGENDFFDALDQIVTGLRLVIDGKPVRFSAENVTRNPSNGKPPLHRPGSFVAIVGRYDPAFEASLKRSVARRPDPRGEAWSAWLNARRQKLDDIVPALRDLISQVYGGRDEKGDAGRELRSLIRVVAAKTRKSKATTVVGSSGSEPDIVEPDIVQMMSIYDDREDKNARCVEGEGDHDERAEEDGDQRDGTRRFIKYSNSVARMSREDERAAYDLWRSQGDMVARDKLVSATLRIVVIVAKKQWDRLNTDEPLDDLIDAGIAGLYAELLKCRDSARQGGYDPNRGNRFGTYIEAVIKDKIVEHLRKRGHTINNISKRDWDLAGQVGKQIQGIRQKTGEVLLKDLEAVARKVCAGKKVSFQQVVDWSQLGGAIAMESLNVKAPASLEDDGDEADEKIDEIESANPSVEAVLLERECDDVVGRAIADALACLDFRERRVIEGRRFIDYDQSPLSNRVFATEFGVSPERIRQVGASAEQKVRARLQAHEGLKAYFVPDGVTGNINYADVIRYWRDGLSPH